MKGIKMIATEFQQYGYYHSLREGTYERLLESRTVPDDRVESCIERITFEHRHLSSKKRIEIYDKDSGELLEVREVK